VIYFANKGFREIALTFHFYTILHDSSWTGL